MSKNNQFVLSRNVKKVTEDTPDAWIAKDKAPGVLPPSEVKRRTRGRLTREDENIDKKGRALKRNNIVAKEKRANESFKKRVRHVRSIDDFNIDDLNSGQ